MSQPGFQFDLCARNAALEARGVVAPRLKKTGTTIAGLLFDVSVRCVECGQQGVCVGGGGAERRGDAFGLQWIARAERRRSPAPPRQTARSQGHAAV